MTYWCVFCGSSGSEDSPLIQVADQIGIILGAHPPHGLVYGGGAQGLMGRVAKSCLQANGHVIGVTTEQLSRSQGIYEGIQETHVVQTMHERKKMMFERARGFIVLPGGSGTLDEFFEIFVWKQLKIHNFPIIIVNDQGYWDPLIGLIKHMVALKFLDSKQENLVRWINHPQELIPFIQQSWNQ
jgi:uncharacterized protein (TIGR00730 family)